MAKEKKATSVKKTANVKNAAGVKKAASVKKTTSGTKKTAASVVRLGVRGKMIGPNAYKDRLDLVEVEVVDGVTGISDSAFKGCVNLKRISFPNMRERKCGGEWLAIGQTRCAGDAGAGYMFSTLKNLETIEIRGDDGDYASVDGLLYDKSLTTLLRCPAGRKEVVTQDVGTIAYNAFRGSRVEVVTLNGDENMVIEEGAFHDCASLRRVVMPNLVKKECDDGESVTYSGAFVDDMDGIPLSMAFAFHGCAHLENIEFVGKGDYCVMEGAVYSSKKDELVFCLPSTAALRIPSSVKSIGRAAFFCTRELKRITIPGTVKTIGADAFGKSSLETVEIKEGVSTIDHDSFAFASKLTELWIPKSVRQILDEYGVDFYMFDGCDALMEVHMPMRLKKRYEALTEKAFTEKAFYGEEGEIYGPEVIFYDGTKSGKGTYFGIERSGLGGYGVNEGKLPYAFPTKKLANEWLQFAAKLGADFGTYACLGGPCEDAYSVVESRFGYAEVDSPDAEKDYYLQKFELVDASGLPVLTCKPSEMTVAQATALLDFLFVDEEGGEANRMRIYAFRLLRCLNAADGKAYNNGYTLFDPACCYWDEKEIVALQEQGRETSGERTPEMDEIWEMEY